MQDQAYESFGVIPKQDATGLDYNAKFVSSKVITSLAATSTDFVTFSEQCASLVSAEDIIGIINRASLLKDTADMLEKLSLSSPALNYKFLPLMSSVSSLLFPSNEPKDMSQAHTSELQDVVHAWGLRWILTDDRNCFFYSIALV